MIMSAPFPTVASVLNRAIERRVFPGAVVEVGRAGGALATIVRGAQTYASDASAVALDTVYDLASLTKVLATTALMVGEVDRGRVRLNDRVRHWIPSWTGDERQPVTIQDLLEHCSGLPAHRPYWEQRRGRASFELAICEEPLACQPRTQAIYSDPGFMLLGFAIEHAASQALDQQFDAWRSRELGPSVEVGFRPASAWLERIAPTEDTPHGEERRGEVHDENCAALDGVAGHAGLFGTAAAVGACARWWLASPARPLFARKSNTPGSSRALGWDTMLPTSSCGTRLSPSAIGHTGFTGTSLWIDPEQDLYVVFLSNRVHPTRAGEGIQEARRALHDAVVHDLAVAG
ncbi:MAG: class A beta-lactamase-related serine hydrolase [Acidobacteria bacterium]|nr:class A beta-lactamase-related serine hydrolase [Acidobacteriota bacterium]